MRNYELLTHGDQTPSNLRPDPQILPDGLADVQALLSLVPMIRSGIHQLKPLLAFLMVLLIAGETASQDFHGGIHAGLVGSQVAGDTYSGFRKAGIYAGGYVGWEFTTHSGIQLELTYFQKGSRENPTEKNDYDSYLFRAGYIELPVLYQYRIKRFIVEGGPSLGFLVGHYEEKDGLTLSDQQGYNKPAPVTFQLNIGLRFFLSQKLGFDFRYNFSMWGIRNEPRTGDVWRLWGYGQFHDCLVLSLFYQFR